MLWQYKLTKRWLMKLIDGRENTLNEKVNQNFQKLGTCVGLLFVYLVPEILAAKYHHTDHSPRCISEGFLSCL